MDIFDIISRGQYASANIADRLLRGRPQEALGAGLAGLTGEERGSYVDVARRSGVPYPELTGFVGNVALDPTSYLPIGRIAKAADMATGGFGQKGIQALAESGLGRWAGQAFDTKYLSPETTKFIGKDKVEDFKNTLQEHLDMANSGMAGGEEAAAKFTKVLEGYSKKNKITEKDLEDIMLAAEDEKYLTALPKEVQDAARHVREYNDKVAELRLTAGKKNISEELAKIKYVPHKHYKIDGTGYDDVMVQRLQQNSADDIHRIVGKYSDESGNVSYGSAKELGLKRASETGDTFIDDAGKKYKFSLPNIREAGKFAETKGLKIDLDVPKLMVLQDKNVSRSIAAKSFYNEVKKFGLTADQLGDIPKNAYQELPVEGLKGIYFPKAFAKDLDRINSVYFSKQPELRGFWSTFDKAQGIFKLTTLGMFPAYHTRNLIGNIWNNWLAGVSNPASYSRAFKLVTKLGSGKGLAKDEQRILELAKKYGVLDSGIYAKEVDIMPSIGGLMSPAGKIGRGILWTSEKGMELGRKYVENPARLAHFIEKMGKNMTDEGAKKASLSVKKYLFDPTDLTVFEKTILRRLAPFYSWSRKNIPLQLEMIINGTPAQRMKALLPAKAVTTSQQEVGNPPKDLLPEWVRERAPVFYKNEGDKYSYFPLQGLLPSADVAQLGRPEETPLELMTPFLKVPLELYTNRSFYFEKPIEQYEGQTREFLWMDMPARYEHVARSIRALSVINKFIPLRNTSNEAPERQSIGQRAVEELLGIKASSVDIKKVYKAKIWELQQDVAALKRGVKMADRYGRNEEINRIAEKLDVVEKRIETIKKFVGEK